MPSAAVSRLPSSLHRGPWRYLRDGDVLHAAVVTLLALLLSAGLLWVGYLVHVWLVAARSRTRPPQRMTLLVFGRKLVDDRPESDYQQRLQRALYLMEDGLGQPVWLLGGRSGGSLSEAAAGEQWLQQHGASATADIRLEQASIDSLENLRHARSLLQPEADACGLPPVGLVTSRYHLARCQLLARRLGFDCVPLGAEARLPLDWRSLQRMLLESGYLMWIDVGLRWAALIGHRRMLARVR